MDDSKPRPDGKPVSKMPGGAGVGTPFAGESSSGGETIVPQNSAPTSGSVAESVDPGATMVGYGPVQFDPNATVIDARLPVDPNATLYDAGATIAPRSSPRRTPAPNSGGEMYSGAAVLQIGDVLGGRYEILQLLGQGGMGAVYKASDRELDRFVALKVIRPELASNPSILARFKQELLLSHQVTHRNVIRIYDLGEAEGLRFITMEFVEGKDLRSIILERSKFPPEEAVVIIEQVCLALEAAHNVGVIHRDLKPQNIMQDRTGRILVMDFGLARMVEGDGMTQTGALVGTMDYMSPEQALGKELDQRSDLFAIGLILYELLTGAMPFKAESALASLIKRTQERAIPVAELDAQIPGALSGIVSKCIERDLEFRYKSVSDVLKDLRTWEGEHSVHVLPPDAKAKLTVQLRLWMKFAGIAAVVLVAIVLFLLRGQIFKPGTNAHSGPSGPVVSLAILPFRNASSDSSLDWLGPSLADMLSTDVGQSAQLRTVSPNSLHQIFSDLRISSDTVLDAATIGRVASFSSADRVVWGQFARFGTSIRIDATVQDIKSGHTDSLKVDVANDNEIPAAVDRLADSIRQKLALPASVLSDLKASSFQPTSKSVAALRDFNLGITLQRDGKNLEAQKQFLAATKEDPSFALAFSRLAQVDALLGYDGDAEESAKEAVGLSQDLPTAEKYLISAIELQVMNNYPDAIKAYENLAAVSPDNSDVKAALAKLYEDSGDVPKARSYYEKILASNPKDVGANIDMGRIQIKSQDPQGSLQSLNQAYSLAVQVDNQEQKATSLHLMAVAYRMLSKPDEVVRNEQEALTIWRSIGQKKGMGLSLNELATAEVSLGKNQDALTNYQEALQIRTDIGDKRGMGGTLMDLGNFFDDRGDHEQALKNYKDALELERELGNESAQADLLNNIGQTYSEESRYEDALTYLQQVLQLREKSKNPADIVDALHNLGQALASMGQYDQAIADYMRALDLRRSINDQHGAALESYGLGAVFDYQGRYGAAVNAKQEALKTFRNLKDRTFWMAEILGGYGDALILAGRADEAKAALDEALGLSRELKNDGLVGQTLGFQGDALFYQGNYKAAHALYDQALQAATRSKESERILLAKIALAQVQVREKSGGAAISNLKGLIEKADEASLKYSSTEAGIYMAEAMMQSHDNAHARQELQRDLPKADKLGQQALSAHAHYLLAGIARESGDTAASQNNYRLVTQALDTMRKDPGAEKLLQRADMKAMYDDSNHWLQGGK